MGDVQPCKTQRPGVQVIEPSLDELVPYIDWSPYFMTWELAGKFPQILEDEVVGEAATALWQDTQERLAWLIEDRRLQAKGVVGIWPADDSEPTTFVSTPRRTERSRWPTPFPFTSANAQTRRFKP